jgi:murein DD-endopeptidase MepM/ murein hydrolase activator NlpD
MSDSPPSTPIANTTGPKTQAIKQGLSERLWAFARIKSTRVYHDKRFYGLMTLGVLTLAAVTVLPQNSEAVATSSEVSSAQETVFDLSRDDLFLIEPEVKALREVSLTLKSGQNLGPLLQDHGLSPGTAHRVTTAFSTVFPPRNIRAGQNFHLSFTGDEFTDLAFKPNVDKTIFITRRGNDFDAREVQAELRFDQMRIAGNIKNSLYLDASDLGAPDKVIVQFANIYEYSVDFQRDIQPGDRFEMIFNVSRNHKDEIVKAGDLLFTSFSPRGKTADYYLYEDSKGRENFYDAKGKTAKRKLRATPVNGARLSSSFGRRKHPISGYRKMHRGVDFAARSGTPIMAAGTGTVVRANRYGGYGNYIRIKHSDGYSTAYAHLKNFARGIKPGKRVTQDQIIGYVGSTGASTGPHLHYEVLKNGKHINPRRLNQLSGRPLAKSELPKFTQRQSEIDSLRRALSAETVSATKNTYCARARQS